MIKNYFNFRGRVFKNLSVFGLLLSLSGWANAQLSGNYTIGTGGNYSTLSAFASAVSTSGVSGAVKAKLISNITETSQTTIASVSFNAPTSNLPTSTNSIDIDGDGFTVTSSNTNAVIDFNGLDFTTLRNMTVVNSNTGSSAKVIQFLNNSDYNIIDGVTMVVSNTTTSTVTGSGGAYVVFSGSRTSMTSAWSGYGNTVRNCTMRTSANTLAGPTMGILMYRTTNTTATDNSFTNNKILNFFVYAYYSFYANGDQFTGNEITRNTNAAMATSGGMGAAFIQYGISTNRSTNFNNNYIHDLPFAGATSGVAGTFYIVNSMWCRGTSSNLFSISNNRVENILCQANNYWVYGFYNYFSRYNNNTTNNWTMTNVNSSAIFYGFYVWYSYDGVDMSNNRFNNCYTNSTNYFYDIYFPYTGRVTMNNNVVKNCLTSQRNLYGWSYIYRIYFGSNAALSNQHSMDNNVIDSCDFGYYAYGYYTYFYNGTMNGNQMTNCRIKSQASSTVYGYIYAIYPGYIYNCQINNNLVANCYGEYGVFGIYGFSYVSGSYRVEVKQNTVQLDHTRASYMYHYVYGMYLYYYYHQKVHVIGNSLDVQNTYGCYPAYTYNQNGTNAYLWDYNNYYFKNLSFQYWYCNNGTANDLNGWNGLGFAGKNETGHLPVYKNASRNDYRIDVFELQNRVPQSIASLYPTTPNINELDQTKAKRNPVNTDHGAHENFMNIRALSTSFSVPSKVCAGTAVKGDIKVRNMFVDTIYNFNITMASDRGARVTQRVTNKILSGDSLNISFNSQLVLSTAGKTKIFVFIDAADDNLNDDTFYFETDVLPAPGGSRFVASTKSTPAIYQAGRPNDITVINQPVMYNINAPRKYTNANYDANYTLGVGGSKWTAEVQAYTASGRSITGASLAAPTASADMELKFVTSDATLEDSMITMVLRVIDFENDCDTFIRRNVLIYPSIKPIFSIPAKICEGDAVLFENKSKVLSGSMEFSWDFGTGNAADKTEAPEPVFQFPGSGTYKVKLSAKTNPHGFMFDTTVDVVVSPIPTIAFNKINACEGDQLKFTNKTTTPAGTGNPVYTWNFGDGSATKNTVDAAHKYSKPGSYNVTLTADLKGCIATMTQKVYQFTKPAAAYTKVEGSCDNDEFSFNNETKVASGLFGSYWNFDDNGAISTDANATHDFNTSGDKRVKLVVTSEFGCKDSITKTIQVKESPKAAYINGPLCSVKPTDFTNTTPNVANAVPQYTWDFGDGTTSGAKSPTKDWKGNLGPKKVTLTVTLDNGCTQKVTKDLVVLTQPTPNFAAEDVCAGEDVIFVNNTTWAQGEIKYKWDFGDGTTSANSDPMKKYNTSVTLTPFVTLYAYINGGCGDSITKNITINETPRTCDFVAEPDYSYGFHGMKFDPIDNSGVVGGQNDVKYVWVFEGGGSQPTSGKNATAFNNFASDGEYKVTMRATMIQTGCECSISKKVVMNRSSVEDLQNGGVAVYPNPSSGVFTVATSAVFGKGSVIEVMNMNGAVVKRMDSMGGMTQVEAGELSSGMYLVKVSNGAQSITRKINIQN